MNDSLLSTPPTDALAHFHLLPIYRCYAREFPRDLSRDQVASLRVPSPLQLVRDPHHPRDRRATAIRQGDMLLGYLSREDNILLGKFVRRGLPVAVRLIGVQVDEVPERRISLEVALLYPPSDITDEQLLTAEDDRFDGLATVAEKPQQRLRPSGDPLSLAHVYPNYYYEQAASLEDRGWR